MREGRRARQPRRPPSAPRQRGALRSDVSAEAVTQRHRSAATSDGQQTRGARRDNAAPKTGLAPRDQVRDLVRPLDGSAHPVAVFLLMPLDGLAHEDGVVDHDAQTGRQPNGVNTLMETSKPGIQRAGPEERERKAKAHPERQTELREQRLHRNTSANPAKPLRSVSDSLVVQRLGIVVPHLSITPWAKRPACSTYCAASAGDLDRAQASPYGRPRPSSSQ